MKHATARVLSIPQPPADRGKLLSVDQVRALFPEGHQPSPDWIYSHVPHKVKMGRRSYWWSEDLLHWLDSLRGAA